MAGPARLTVARVVVTAVLPEGATEPLLAAGHQVVHGGGDVGAHRLAEDLTAADAVVCTLTDRLDGDVLRAAGRLQVVSTVAVGYDNVDVATAADLGMVVCHTPGVLDESTADLAFLLVLAATRLASDAERDLRAGRWRGWSVTDHLGGEVHGRTLGVVGFGRIGRAVARRAAAFDMVVRHCSRRPTGLPGEVPDLDELLGAVDVVTLHVPATPDTHHLIDRRRLGLLRPGAVLVNTARGSVVDEAALAAALHEGMLFAAGLDVYEREPAVHPDLLTAPRTVLLPHIGSATVPTRTAMATLACQQVVDVLAGREPAHPVPGSPRRAGASPERS